MMLIRPIRDDDLDRLVTLASQAGVGVTTLPVNRDLLAQRIDESQRAFAKELPPEHAYYLFALEDTGIQQIVGVSAIKARVGLDEVWYNYRVSTTVNASKELGIHVQTPTLYLSNDMTNCTEICTLFLAKEYRNGHNGRMLSKSRFLFIADFAELFSTKIFAEMRGYSEEDGHSPFWENLGQRFFGFEFKKADYLTGIGNKAFIAELMPKYPIYIPFFDRHTQEIIGQVHPQTKPALAMLEREGFNYNGMVDIFDAGPLVESFVPNIRAIRESVKRHTMVSQQAAELESDLGDNPLLVSNRSFSDFRLALVNAGQVRSDSVILSEELLGKLGLESGDLVRTVPLRTPR